MLRVNRFYSSAVCIPGDLRGGYNIVQLTVMYIILISLMFFIR